METLLLLPQGVRHTPDFCHKMLNISDCTIVVKISVVVHRVKQAPIFRRMRLVSPLIAKRMNAHFNLWTKAVL